MQADLLTSEDKQSYFINCRVKGELLEVGAVFIAPSSCSPMKLISEDGVSLTVGEVNDEKRTFSVHLIPETLSRTTLGFRHVGDGLNLEIDAMTQAVVETVRRVMAKG